MQNYDFADAEIRTAALASRGYGKSTERAEDFVLATLARGLRGNGKQADAARANIEAILAGKTVQAGPEAAAAAQEIVKRMEMARAGIPLGAGNRAQRRAAMNGRKHA